MSDPYQIRRAVMDGIRDQLAKAMDKVESALDDILDVWEELDPGEVPE